MTYKINLKTILLCISLYPLWAHADIVWENQASLTLGSNYYSNLEMSENDESVWIYSAVPGYRVSALDGKNTWFASAALRVERSTNTDVSDNREDPSGRVGWTRELEKGNLGLSASYVRQSTRQRQFRQTGILFEDGTDTTRSVVANWEHNFSDRLNFTAVAGLDKKVFGLQQGGGDSNVFTDSLLRYVNTGVTYKFDDKYRPYVRLGANDFRALRRIEYQNTVVGLMVDLSPQFTYDVSLGNTHFSSEGENELIGALRSAYLGSRYRLNADISRSVVPTDIGNTEVIDALVTNYVYDLTERSRLGAGVALTQNKSFNANKTQQVSAFYSRDLSASWIMNLSLEFRNIKTQDEDSQHGNAVGISFTYNTPTF